MKLYSTPVNTMSNILGTVTANVINYFDLMFPKEFFNHKYVDTKLTSIERYQSKKKLVGNRTPAISFKPNLNIEDVEFKGHEFMKSEARIFHCDEDRIHISGYFERIKVDFDVKMKLETRSKVYDTVIYMKDQMQFNAPFYLDMSGSGTVLSIPLPNEILKQIMILKNWYSDDELNDINNLVSYLETFKQGPKLSFTKALNLALGRNSIFMNYSTNILTSFSGLPSFEFGKNGRARGENYISMSLTTEFWVPTRFALWVDNVSTLLEPYKQVNAFIELMVNTDITKLKTLEFKNLISEIFDSRHYEDNDVRLAIRDLLLKPEFYSIKVYFKQILKSKNYEKLIYSIKSTIDYIKLRNFLNECKDVLSYYLNEFKLTNNNESNSDVVKLSLMDDWEKYNDKEKKFIKLCDEYKRLHNTKPYHLDVIQEYNSSYELNYERNLVLEDRSPTRLHKGAPIFVSDINLMWAKSLEISKKRNDKFEYQDIITEKKDQIDEILKSIKYQIKNGDNVRVDDINGLYRDISSISQNVDMMALNLNMLSHPEYDRDNKKLFYYNGFTTEVNSKIDTLELASEFDDTFKNVLDYYINDGEDVKDMLSVVVYSRDVFVNPADYSMNWNNFILTIMNPKYNLNYYLVIYRDEELYKVYYERWFEENKA